MSASDIPVNVPFRVESKIVTWQGDWTAEQIDAGEAGDPSDTGSVQSVWYIQNDAGEYVEITDDEWLDRLNAENPPQLE